VTLLRLQYHFAGNITELFGSIGKYMSCCTETHRATVAFTLVQHSGWRWSEAEIFRKGAAIYKVVQI